MIMTYVFCRVVGRCAELISTSVPLHGRDKLTAPAAIQTGTEWIDVGGRLWTLSTIKNAPIRDCY